MPSLIITCIECNDRTHYEPRDDEDTINYDEHGMLAELAFPYFTPKQHKQLDQFRCEGCVDEDEVVG
jgi:hypothetical protein